MLDNFGRDILILLLIISSAVIFFNIFIDVAVVVAGHLFAYFLYSLCCILGYTWGFITQPTRTYYEIKTDLKNFLAMPFKFFINSR